MFSELVCQPATCLSNIEFIVKIAPSAIVKGTRCTRDRVSNVKGMLVVSNEGSGVGDERAGVITGPRATEVSGWCRAGRRERAMNHKST